jgi:hypothetical protein
MPARGFVYSGGSSFELPGAAILAPEELGGFGISDDLFLHGVPLDGAVHEEGNEGEMAWSRTAMGSLHRGDGGLP